MNKNILKKSLAIFLSTVLAVGSVYVAPKANIVNADTNSDAQAIGNLADKVTGTWVRDDGEVLTNAMLLDKLPTIANKGISRWTTDNYDNSTGAFDIGEWGTSFMWNYSGQDQWGNATYALPVSYKASSQGFYVKKPSTIHSVPNAVTFLMEQPENGTVSDFVVGPTFEADSKKVDKVTDWTYDVVFENSTNPAVNVKSTVVQGSPFSYYQATGTNQMKVMRVRSLPSYISYYNGTSIENSTMLVLRVFDGDDEVSGYSNHDYYAVYVPKGTTWTRSAGVGYADDGIGTLTANFPSEEQAYMSFAWLCEGTGPNSPGRPIDSIDEQAKKIAESYEKYAYNFITDTKASYTYNSETATVTTKYEYTIDKKDPNAVDGTIMGILPHQYKNMSGYTYLDNTARTIRGTMKFLTGNSYETKLTYTGILPSMMPIYESEYATLQEYIDDFMEEYGPTDTKVTKESYSENTYDSGKKLNRAIQVMAAAESIGDAETTEELLNGIKAELDDWFTYEGEEDTKYFYYDEGVGSLFGFPQSYFTVDGMTDHHFHYGYFINAAAQVALRDPSFVDKYGNIVDELIGDIATAEENTPDSKYPQFRYFSQYEGHSWASGHANFSDGNNQESSSEALNAWAGLILYGQATGNEELTERGIYLYTTEVSSVNNYWFDIDGDILDSNFKKGTSSLPKYIQASMIWGGKYDYATWWTAEPLQIQGINILPMTAASFYAARNKQYILDNFETAQINEAEYNGPDKDPNRWNEIWSVYLAMADPAKALDYFNPDCAPEAGDSKAHAFHTIMAFDKAGTPDLTVTSNTPLSSTFKNADGDMTYVVYNAGEENKTVTFSDGTTVEATPGEMSVLSEADVVGRASYSVEHYIQQADGAYILNVKENKSAKIGNEVTATAKSYTGYTLDESVAGAKKTGIVSEDGSLVLKLYYKITEIVDAPIGADDSLYQKLGNYNGSELSYYLIRDDIGVSVKLLDNNETFYIEYNGTYTKDNTKGYMNNIETPDNVLGGVYKFQTKTLVVDTYTTLKIKGDDGKLVTMIIKYGNPTGAPNLDDPELEIPTQPDYVPTEIISLVLGTTTDNSVIVTFRESEEQNDKGQTYNVYVNDKKVLEGVDAGTHFINDVSAGTCNVKVTAVLSNLESEGVTDSIKVSGEKYEEPTTAPEPTTEPTVVETTTEPIVVETTTEPVVTETTTEPTVVETTTEPGVTETTTEPMAVETTTEPVVVETTTEPTAVETTTEPVVVETTTEPTVVETTTEPTAVETTTEPVVVETTTEPTATETITKPVAVETTAKQTVTPTKAASKKVKVGRTKVKKATKKKSAKKIKISLKRIKGAAKYQIQISKKRKFKKKNILVRKTVKKIKFTIKRKKLKNRKKLFVRARAIKIVNGKKYYGKWSKKKKVKIKK